MNFLKVDTMSSSRPNNVVRTIQTFNNKSNTRTG